MSILSISKATAQRFLLKRCGLLGKTPFRGREGVKKYIDRVGCVQYDPVDICGVNHELSLFAHVEGFTRELLNDMLYKERSLIDYFDKNMAIMKTTDWPYLSRFREANRKTRSMEQIARVRDEILTLAHEKGCISSKELPYSEKVDWYWSDTRLSRAALEAMYFAGDLVVHHKDRAIKSYAPASDLLPKALLEAEPPCKELADMQRWQVLRRIGAVGLLPMGASDAWLGIQDLKAEARSRVFEQLLATSEICPVQVEGLKNPLYMKSNEQSLLAGCEKPFTGAKHVRFLPPLDCLLWDRKVINKLFDFHYAWEIYTPQEKLQYAHYTMPVLYGQRLCGRVQLQCRRKEGVLALIQFWPEEGFAPSKAFENALHQELDRLCAFHGLDSVWVHCKIA